MDFGVITGKLGRGGFSHVFGTSLGYALKVTPNSKLGFPEDATLREIAVMRAINFPLLSVEWNEEETTLVIPIFYPIKHEDITRRLLFGLCCSLRELHMRNILHLDIKPENVMTKEEGRNACLIDFGLSHLHSDVIPPSLGNYFTLMYSPLEVVEGRYPTKKSDIWALGLTLAELFILRNTETRVYASPSGWMDEEGITEEMRLKEYSSIMEGIDNLLSQGSGCSLEERNLIHSLLRFNPEDRPDIEEILKMPYFSTLEGPLLVEKKKKIEIKILPFSGRDIRMEHLTRIAERRALNGEILGLATHLMDTLRSHRMTDDYSCLLLACYYYGEESFTVNTIAETLEMEKEVITQRTLDILKKLEYNLGMETEYISQKRKGALAPRH